MESASDQALLVVVVGCTASGKSAAAYKLAQKYDGEIIAADSRTIYRGLDIGTAKPSPAQRQRIPHHMIDILEPNQAFTVVDFKTQALRAISSITERGKLPILVGGTGLYIDAVLFDFSFRAPSHPRLREKLELLSIPELQALSRRQNVNLPENINNRRHLIRTLETLGQVHHSKMLRPNTIIIGLDVEREALQACIKNRVTNMFNQGLESEVRKLIAQHGRDCPALQTIGYQEFRPYLEGKGTLKGVKDEIIRDTGAYAKRQRTWFKRNKSIHWVKQQEEIEDLMTTL